MPINPITHEADPPPASEPITIEQALQLPPTVSAAKAAVLLGISRTGVYEAIHRKEIPSISIGRRMVVPTRPLLALLGLDPQAPSTRSTPSSRTPSTQVCDLAECLGRVGRALFNRE